MRRNVARFLSSTGGEWRAMTLLLLLVLVPSTCVVWLLNRAMRNERLAARQALNDVYMSHLRSASDRLQQSLGETRSRITHATEGQPPAQQLLTCLERDWCDGLVTTIPEQTLPDDEPPLATITDEELQLRWSRAHHLADLLLAASANRVADGHLRRSGVAGIWSMGTLHGDSLILLSEERIRRMAEQVIADSELPASARMNLLAPDEEPDASAYLVKLVGPTFPGWRLVVSLDRPALLRAVGSDQVHWYRVVAVLAIAAAGGLALLMGVVIHRQSRLARLKNDLVATVSHELKTPLASMRLLVDTLLDSEPATPRVREYLELISRENTRLTRLIENFLTFSRMERGLHKLSITLVDPKAIIAQAVEAAGERFQEPDCELAMLTADDLPPLAADNDATVTILLNLLDNAYKYTPPPRKIELRTSSDEQFVSFAVRDNGIGMSRSAARRVFQRFYQVEQRLNRTAGGCGLGLSIVQHLVTAQQGQIELHTRPGQGSTFVVRLPRAAHAPARSDEICVP